MEGGGEGGWGQMEGEAEDWRERDGPWEYDAFIKQKKVKINKKVRPDHNYQMHAGGTSSGEVTLPDPTLENNTPHDSWHQTLLLSKLQGRLNGNYDSLICCPFVVVVVYKYSYNRL